MKKQLFNFLFLILLVVSVSAQSNEAVKIDEFGNLLCDEYLSRMDSVMSQANNNPNAEIYVFVYEGKTREFKCNGTGETYNALPQYNLATTKIRSMKKLFSSKKFSAERFNFVQAGLRENFVIEFWLVPAGAAKPTPTPTITKIKYRKGKAQEFCIGCCD